MEDTHTCPSPPSPDQCHLIPPFEEFSSFWKQHLQVLTGPSPNPPAATQPSPWTQEHSAELTSPPKLPLSVEATS